MKKKLSLIVLACALTLGVSGCGSEADTTTSNDRESMMAYSEAIVSSFSQTPDEVFDQYEEMSDLQLNLMLLNTGLPVDSENFLSMVESWKAGEKECGEFISYGDFEAEMTSSGIVVSTEAEYENKTADIEFTFDEEQKMDSMTINAHYSTSEILKKAGLNTILGMGTVFLVLIFISFIISLFRFIPELEKKFKKNKTTEVTISVIVRSQFHLRGIGYVEYLEGGTTTGPLVSTLVIECQIGIIFHLKYIEAKQAVFVSSCIQSCNFHGCRKDIEATLQSLITVSVYPLRITDVMIRIIGQ